MSSIKRDKSNSILVKVFDNQDILNICEYAFVRVCPELIDLVKVLSESYKSLAQQNVPVLDQQAAYYGGIFIDSAEQGIFSDGPRLPEEIENAIAETEIQQEGVLFIDDNWLNVHEQCLPQLRTEGSCIAINDYGFKLISDIKHTSIELTTETIPFWMIGL